MSYLATLGEVDICQTECGSAADVPVGEGSDDKPWCISKIFVKVTELSIADVNEAVALLLIPVMSELGKPLKGLRGGDLLTQETAVKEMTV